MPDVYVVCAEYRAQAQDSGMGDARYRGDAGVGRFASNRTQEKMVHNCWGSGSASSAQTRSALLSSQYAQHQSAMQQSGIADDAALAARRLTGTDSSYEQHRQQSETGTR